MSKTTTRGALAAASAIAEEALAAIKPFVLRAEIVGSIRRGRQDVGDVDIVVELPPDDPWANMRMGTALIDELGYYALRGGTKSVHCERTVGWPAIDFYLATSETWGITQLIRTGSAAHNIRMANVARKRLPVRKLTLAGIQDTAGKIVASRSEQEIFAAIGLGFIAPAQREAPELEFMVRQETVDGD